MLSIGCCNSPLVNNFQRLRDLVATTIIVPINRDLPLIVWFGEVHILYYLNTKTHKHFCDLKSIIIKAHGSLCLAQQGLDGPYVSLYSHKICLSNRVRNGHVRAGRSLLLNCTQQRLISRYKVPHGELPASLN